MRVVYFGSVLSSSHGQGTSQGHLSPSSKQRKQLVLGSEACKSQSVEICGLQAMGTLEESRVGLRMEGWLDRDELCLTSPA